MSELDVEYRRGPHRGCSTTCEVKVLFMVMSAPYAVEELQCFKL